MVDKSVQDFIRDLRAAGLEPFVAGSGHYQIRKEDGGLLRGEGGMPLSFSATPSDVRWRMNAEQSLRRNGIDIAELAEQRAQTAGVEQNGRAQERVRQRVLRQRIQFLLDQAAEHGQAMSRAEFVRVSAEAAEAAKLPPPTLASGESAIRRLLNGDSISPEARHVFELGCERVAASLHVEAQLAEIERARSLEERVAVLQGHVADMRERAERAIVERDELLAVVANLREELDLSVKLRTDVERELPETLAPARVDVAVEALELMLRDLSRQEHRDLATGIAKQLLRVAA